MDNWKKKLRTYYNSPYYIALFSALFAGLIVHLYALTNSLHNYDDIATQPYGFGTGISSGRWFLQLLGDTATALGFAYNLPLVNGLLLIGLLAVSAGLLAVSLRIRNRKFAVLLGILFVVFPATTSTMYFRFTAPYYGLGVLLAVAAAWVLHRCKFALLLSGLFTALSLGIYQAYTPITIGIFVLLLLQAALGGGTDWKTLIRQGLYYCAALILGLVLYFVFLKLTLAITGAQLSSYQDIDRMGLISLASLPRLVKQAYKALLLLPMEDYCGVAATPFIRGLYLLLGIGAIGLTVYLLATKVRKAGLTVLVCLFGLIFPLAVNFVVVMCPQSAIYTLMVYGFVLVPCLPMVICEALPVEDGKRGHVHKCLTRAVACLLSLVMFYYGYEANVSYTAMHFANRHMENYYTSMVAQVRMTEGFTADKTWAFIGDNQDPLQFSVWKDHTRYGGNAHVDGLINAYSRQAWLYHYVGYAMPLSTPEEIAALSQTEEVKAMPCWPDQGSIKVIGDTVVIKFQELSE